MALNHNEEAGIVLSPPGSAFLGAPYIVMKEIPSWEVPRVVTDQVMEDVAVVPLTPGVIVLMPPIEQAETVAPIVEETVVETITVETIEFVVEEPAAVEPEVPTGQAEPEPALSNWALCWTHMKLAAKYLWRALNAPLF